MSENVDNLLEQDRKTIYEELALQSICRGEALSTSICSQILHPMGIDKEKYKLHTMGDLLRKVGGIKVLEPLYPGASACVIIEALAELDSCYTKIRRLDFAYQSRLAHQNGEPAPPYVKDKPLLEKDSPDVTALLAVVMAKFDEKEKSRQREKAALDAFLQTEAPAGVLTDWQTTFFASCKEQNKRGIIFTDPQIKQLRILYLKLRNSQIA